MFGIEILLPYVLDLVNRLVHYKKFSSNIPEENSGEEQWVEL